MSGKPVPVSTIVFAAISVVLAIVVLLFVLRLHAEKRFAVDSLVEALESGVVSEGDSLSGFHQYSKPISWAERQDDAGQSWMASTYSHNYDIVTIYSHDRIAFAAHRVVGVRPNEDTWYFCDTDLMTKYITLAMESE